MTVAREDLVVGGVYEVRARNFSVGIWDGKSFIGRRAKFHEIYLDEEVLGWSVPEPEGVVRRLGAFTVALPPAWDDEEHRSERQVVLAWLDACADLYRTRWRLEDELMGRFKVHVTWPAGLEGRPEFDDMADRILAGDAIVQRAREIREADPTIKVPDSTKRARQELKDEGIIE